VEKRIWHKAYASPVSPSIDYEKITLEQALTRTAARFPNVTALDMMGKRISYKELEALVNRFAAALADMGVSKGDRVAMILPNMPQMIIATYAAWRIGAVVVMNNPLYTERELTHQLGDSESKVAVAFDLLVPRMLSIQKNTSIEKIVACHIRDYLPFPLKQLFPVVKKQMHRPLAPGEDALDFMDLLRAAPEKPAPVDVGFDDLAALLYTGGTTGVSKGVMLTHGNLSINVQQFKALLYDMEEGNENVLGILPFFHSAGFTAGMNTCIYRGFTDVLVPKPDLEIFIKMIKKHRPSIFGGVPTMYVGLLNHPNLPPKPELKFIKGSVSGAAPLAMETLKHWEDRVGAQIIEVYGMTEMSPISHANPWGGKTKAGSVGIPFPDTDCRIVDVETGEKDMPPGEAGEIILKGPQQMQGYYKRPDETADSLRDGWFYTGDIGYMDEDGYLFVVDRKKDMIIAGGFNIYPRDIDEILYEHPKILEACTIGLPDAYRGETVKAFVVLQPGQTMTEQEVADYCREKLAAYKVPKMVEFADDLPKSAIGKVLRRELKEKELAKMKEAG
jgi:long-chain acyl-CoA synthetase